MTCEIAVMNKRGIALAADSAVTLGDGIKIYHHSEKLFQLRSGAPVGFLIFGAAEIMGVPWEVVIRSYDQHLGSRRFDQLSHYASDFLSFIEASSGFFPESVQRQWFAATVESYWREQLLGSVRANLEKRPPRAASAILGDLLNKELELWHSYAAIESFQAHHADKVLAEYRHSIDEVRRSLFATFDPDEKLRDALDQSVRLMVTRRWFHSWDRSGVAVAGLGEAEPFPALEVHHIGAIVAGKLRWAKIDEARISRENSAIVAPLAQSEMIDMFYRGIDPQLDEKLDHIASRCANHVLAKDHGKSTASVAEKFKKAFRKALEDEIDGNYREPLMAAVDALPRHGLAQIAETLVSLTAFRKRMSVGQKETVGGTIDVALLSKGEGFVWVKRNGTAQHHPLART